MCVPPYRLLVSYDAMKKRQVREGIFDSPCQELLGEDYGLTSKMNVINCQPNFVKYFNLHALCSDSNDQITS